MNDVILFEKAICFLGEIGIETVYGTMDDEAGFLPGFLIEKGKIIMDKNKIKFRFRATRFVKRTKTKHCHVMTMQKSFFRLHDVE